MVAGFATLHFMAGSANSQRCEHLAPPRHRSSLCYHPHCFPRLLNGAHVQNHSARGTVVHPFMFSFHLAGIVSFLCGFQKPPWMSPLSWILLIFPRLPWCSVLDFKAFSICGSLLFCYMFLFRCMCIPVWAYVNHVHAGAHRGQKASDSLELE